ncbi:MAG: arginine--tRNA ligase [Rhodobacteraceae bacterium]|nr:arginine--tRNA ligase [Paracoccaceae bacterium]
MNIFAEIRGAIGSAIEQLAGQSVIPDGIDLSRMNVERPRDATHGEISTNAAMILAKPARRPPRVLAEALADVLSGDERVARVSVAGPGFLNLVLRPEEWLRAVRSALQLGMDYGRNTDGRNRRVNLEFVSANPTGPLHLGHGRGAVFGDALGRLLEYTGHDVTREYYVNDAGSQVDILARSAYLRYLEDAGLDTDFGPESYRGDYLIEVGKSLHEAYGDRLLNTPESRWLPEVRDFAIKRMLRLIKSDLKLLGIRMDRYFHESSLAQDGRIDQALKALRERGLVYRGKLPPPKGRRSVDWEPRRQTLFRSTAHGDDVDRPIRKSDGSWTYFAPDIAYHHDKIARGYDVLINVFGADHGGYVQRLRAVVSALSDGKAHFDIKLIQLVNVVQRDERLKMSKRAGNFVQLQEAVEAVGADVLRFVMLMRRNDAPLDFDFEEVVEKTKDNPVFYVQYAHARTCSVLGRAEAAGFRTCDANLAEVDLGELRHASQIAFARRISEWPRVVEVAARHHEPHRIVFYLTDLARDFHAMWARGNREPELRILDESDVPGTLARLALARASAVVIATGLEILGIAALEEM